MSFIGMCAVCAVAFAVLTGAFNGLSFFFTKRIKNGYQLALPTFLFGTAMLFAIVSFCTFGVFLFPFQTPLSLRIMGVAALAVGTLFLTEPVTQKKTHRNGLLFLLCLTGTALIPPTAPLWDLPFGWALCFPLALVWMGFMVMINTLDRVTLLGFLSLSSLTIGMALLASPAFLFFPSEFNAVFLSLLFLLLGLIYYLKNNGCFILGQPVVFFISYLLGYMGIQLFALGKGVYAPIFVAYELFEILFAMGANFWLYKKLTPIQVPFFIERALATGIAPGKALRRVFMWCLVFAALGLMIVRMPTSHAVSFYLLTAFMLTVPYMQLKDWGRPKVRFRDLFSDIKQGVKVGIDSFKEELNETTLKKQGKTPKKKKKK